MIIIIWFISWQTPQSALVKNETYDEYNIDDYPLGMNAIVAVVSYTVCS